MEKRTVFDFERGDRQICKRLRIAVGVTHICETDLSRRLSRLHADGKDFDIAPVRSPRKCANAVGAGDENGLNVVERQFCAGAELDFEQGCEQHFETAGFEYGSGFRRVILWSRDEDAHSEREPAQSAGLQHQPRIAAGFGRHANGIVRQGNVETCFHKVRTVRRQHFAAKHQMLARIGREPRDRRAARAVERRLKFALAGQCDLR